MMQVSSSGPYERLSALERLGYAHRAELPSQAEVRDEWVGVGFRLGGRPYVAAMGEITEILTYPELSRVPHAKPWVRGIANVRGNLLPVMDLSGYLDKGRSNPNRLSRVLVIEQNGLVAGLLVDEVLGMRRFFDEDWHDGNPHSDDVVGAYVTGVYRRDGADWPVFSMAALASDPQFLKVAE
ncbi:MAG TPA: chemotaxis protein CheW [Gammaproteobacteria bacterium]|nr:chemotaxis protein CheW [Gammaproteobacteria bacterium]